MNDSNVIEAEPRASVGVKLSAAVVTVLGAMGLLAGVAGASGPSATTTAVAGGGETIKDELVAIATTVLPYAAAVVAIVFGWKLVKRFF